MDTSSSIERLINQLEWGPYHNKLLWNCLGGWINGYMWLAGSILMVSQMNDVSLFQKTLLGSVLNLGAVLGCFAFPYVSDIWGKVYVFKRVVVLLLVGGSLLAATFSFALTIFALFLVGLGAGGETTTPINVMHDFTPSRYKGKVGVLSVGASLGPIVAHLSGLVLVEVWDLSFARWRVQCLVNLLVTVMLIWFRARLVESPVYLFNKGKPGYKEVLQILIQDTQPSLEEPLLVPNTPPPKSSVPTTSIFSQSTRWTTIKLLMCSLISTFASSGHVAFLTLYYPYQEPRDLFIAFIVMQITGVAGASQTACIVNSLLGRRWSYAVCYLLAALLVVPWIFSNELWVILLVGGVFNAVLQLGSGVKNLVNAESYNSIIRGQGVGFLSAAGRCASIASPLSIGLIQGFYGNSATMWFLAGVFGLTGLLATSLRETKPVYPKK